MPSFSVYVVLTARRLWWQVERERSERKSVSVSINELNFRFSTPGPVLISFGSLFLYLVPQATKESDANSNVFWGDADALNYTRRILFARNLRIILSMRRCCSRNFVIQQSFWLMVACRNVVVYHKISARLFYYNVFVCNRKRHSARCKQKLLLMLLFFPSITPKISIEMCTDALITTNFNLMQNSFRHFQ